MLSISPPSSSAADTSQSSLQAALAALAQNGGNLEMAVAGDQFAAIPNSGSLTDNDRQLLSKLTGLPFNSDGTPDFEAAKSQGETIKNGIPGGFNVASLNDGENSVVFFAANVAQDRANGSLTGDINPQYVKGMQLKIGSSGSATSHQQFIKSALDYLNKLSESDVQGSPNYTPRATFDTSVRSSFETTA